MTTFTLTPAEYSATLAHLAKVNERAAKKGFTGSVTVVGERKEVTRTNEFTGIKTTEVVYETAITGTAPSYGGWTFLARVDVVGDSFTLATTPDTDILIDRSVVRPGECDHCNHNRARKASYLVRNDETGEIRNVGSTCIKDFLGWDVYPVFIFEDAVAREVEAISSGPRTESTYDVATVIRTAYAATRAFGWVSASSYDSTPTRDWVLLALGTIRPTAAQTASLATLREFAAEADETTTKIVEWILSDDFDTTSNYTANLRAAVEAGIATHRQIGLLASAPTAYARSLETAAEIAAKAAAAAEKPESNWIANVGDKKVRIEGTIDAIRYISGNYGTTVLYTITTAEGNVVKWFASREALGETEGVEVVVEATIKKHDTFNDVKQTVITRAKRVEA